MGFLSGLLGGGGGGGTAGIGNSSTSNETANNEKTVNVADYSQYSGAGTVVSLDGLMGSNTVNVSLLDGGAIGKAFGYAGHVADLQSGDLRRMFGYAGHVADLQSGDLRSMLAANELISSGALADVSSVEKNALAHIDQTGTRNRDVVVMGVAAVGGIVLMMWLVSGSKRHA